MQDDVTGPSRSERHDEAPMADATGAGTPHGPETLVVEAPHPGTSGGGGFRRGGRSARATRDLTTGSIPRNLWLLSWPMMVSQMFRVVDMMADLVWAGRGFGTTTIAGVGAAQQWAQVAMTWRMGLDTSVRAMVSRAVGAGDLPRANHIALQGFTISTIISTVMAILGILFTPFLMGLLGISDEAIAEGTLYMRLQFVAMATTAMMMMSAAILQASGDSVTPMRIDMVTRILHLVLSPFAIFGWIIPGFGGMGIAGASVTNALAGSLGFAWLAYILFSGKSRLHLSLKGYYVDLPVIWRIVRIGAPASVTSAERSVAQIVLFGLVTPFGTTAVAAFSLVNRIQMLVNLGSMGMGQGAGILVGQNLGASQPRRARKTVAWAVAFVTALNLVTGGLVIAFPSILLSIFSPSPELMEVASTWLRIQAVGFVMMGASMVFMQSYNTAGDTLVPMIVVLLTIWGVQQPLAYLLPRVTELGQYGVAWAPVVGIVARLSLYVPYFFWGPWLKKKVL